MKIYSTNDMEGAIREMCRRNYKSMIYQSHRTLRIIPARLNRVADIPTTLCRAWDSFAPKTIAKWELSPNLLIYRPSDHFDLLPECDAMTIVECPIQYTQFEHVVNKVKMEVILYKPPTWELHEELVDFLYPSSAHYRTLLLFIKGIRGAPTSQLQQDALSLSGHDPKLTTVFNAHEIAPVLGMSARQVKMLLGFKFRGFHTRYSTYLPMLRPNTSDLSVAFDVLTELPAQDGEWRLLRFDDFEESKLALKQLVKYGYVRRGKDIYLLQDGYRQPDYIAIDAVNNARRGDWYKMRTIVDRATPIDILSEQPAPI